MEYAPVTCRGGGEGPDGRHDRVGWGRKGYGVCSQLPVEGGGEGPDGQHDRVGWGRKGYEVCSQLPVEGVEKGLTDCMTEYAGVGRGMEYVPSYL